MVKILGGKMVPVALVLAGGLWISSCAASQSADADTARPGSFQAIMAAKAPQVYGPHLAAADAAPAKVVASTCQPGSFAAIMSAKLPPSARPGNAELYRDCR